MNSLSGQRAEKTKEIHVAMSTDRNYLEYLLVAVCSILKNLSRNYCLVLHVMNSDLSGEDREKVGALKRVRDFKVDFIEPDVSPFKKLEYKGSTYITRISTARFLLPELLPQLDKLIYLDCDLIIRDDLSKLWEIDIDGHPFGAVEEPTCRARNWEINVPKEYSHFNSGVMLMNLKRLREIDFRNTVCDFLEEHHDLVIGDQDTLNAIYHKEWRVLPVRWNVTTSMYIWRYENEFYRYKEDVVKEAFKDPAVCHFTDKQKPNSFLCRHPYKHEYRKYWSIVFERKCTIQDVSFKSFSVMGLYVVRNKYMYLRYQIKKNAPFLITPLKVIKRICAGDYFKNKN